MSNGQSNGNKGLVPFLRPNIAINADEYASNQHKIAHLRQMAATMEQTNEQAHQRYVQMELQKRVEEGERAQQMLASMSQAASNQPVITQYPASLLPPPTTSHTLYQGQQSELHIIPSTARIEEIPSSASSHDPQQVGGASATRVSSNPSTGRTDQSGRNQRPYYNTSNLPNSNGPRPGGTLQGRWQTNQPPLSQQQQLLLTQSQGQSRWQPQQQQTEQRQHQQKQQQQPRQQQQQTQQRQQLPVQTRYTQPQTTQYGQSSTSTPGQFISQHHFSSQTYSGQGSNHPQTVTIPTSNRSSSLEGALGDQVSRVSSSSSHRASPAFSIQPTGQNGAQVHASTQKRPSMDKDAIAADVIQRLGPNYISDMVATAQASSSTTAPKPPTRSNRAAAASKVPASSSGASLSPKSEAVLDLELPGPISPAQVRSNTRHIATQRPDNAPVAPVSAPAPQTVPASSPTPASSHAHQPKSNAPSAQSSVPNGVSSNITSRVATPSDTSTGPSQLYAHSSTASTQAPSLVSQNAASALHQLVVPDVDSGRRRLWNVYIPPENQNQPAFQGGLQHSLPGPYLSQGRTSASSLAPPPSDVQDIAARGPMTPKNQQPQAGTSPRTPASADKKHLARDILRSLGGSRLLNGKRKRSEEHLTGVKRGRIEQPNSDTYMSDSMSGQPASVDALPVHPTPLHPTALRKEEEEEEIGSVENMISLPPPPIPGPSNNFQAAATPPLQTDEVIDISDEESQNESLAKPTEELSITAPVFSVFPPPETLPSKAKEQVIDISDDKRQNEGSLAKPAEGLPIRAPVFSTFPPPETLPSKTKEPLFLPSPSSSPRSARSPQYLDDDVPMLEDDNLQIEMPRDMPPMDASDVSMEQPLALRPKKSKRRTEVYVLIPPPPDWVKRAKQSSNKVQSRQQKRSNAKRKPWINEDEAVGDSEDAIEDWEDEGTSQRRPKVDTKEADEKRRQAAAAEREAMSLTSSLLRKQPCKWRYCDVVMNTIDRLSQHVAQHAQDKPGPYICLWQNCTRRFSEEGKLLAHLESHVRNPVLCPYQDCDLSFRTPKYLVAHCALEHSNDIRRPSTEPFKPTLMSMPPVPLTLPSYMVVPRDIRQTPISKGRHALLGPWVLRNIFGPVNLAVKRQNAAVPLRSVRGPMDREDFNPPITANDEYDFLRPKSPSSTPKTHFDDLASAAASKLIHAGLTFWGPKVEVKEENDPSGIVESFDSKSHRDPAMDDSGHEHKDPQELSSALDAVTDERPTLIGQEDNDTSGPGEHAESENDAGCVLV